LSSSPAMDSSGSSCSTSVRAGRLATSASRSSSLRATRPGAPATSRARPVSLGVGRLARVERDDERAGDVAAEPGEHPERVEAVDAGQA
jgi:hypothetical protein